VFHISFVMGMVERAGMIFFQVFLSSDGHPFYFCMLGSWNAIVWVYASKSTTCINSSGGKHGMGTLPYAIFSSQIYHLDRLCEYCIYWISHPLLLNFPVIIRSRTIFRIFLTRHFFVFHLPTYP